MTTELSSTVATTAPIVPENPETATPIRARHVLILGALSALGPLSTDMYLPALPALSHELGATMAQTQLTLSAGILGLALGQVLSGPSSDALGRRRPLLVGMAAFALASLLCIIALPSPFSRSCALSKALRAPLGLRLRSPLSVIYTLARRGRASSRC